MAWIEDELGIGSGPLSRYIEALCNRRRLHSALAYLCPETDEQVFRRPAQPA